MPDSEDHQTGGFFHTRYMVHRPRPRDERKPKKTVMLGFPFRRSQKLGRSKSKDVKTLSSAKSLSSQSDQSWDYRPTEDLVVVPRSPASSIAQLTVALESSKTTSEPVTIDNMSVDKHQEVEDVGEEKNIRTADLEQPQEVSDPEPAPSSSKLSIQSAEVPLFDANSSVPSPSPIVEEMFDTRSTGKKLANLDTERPLSPTESNGTAETIPSDASHCSLDFSLEAGHIEEGQVAIIEIGDDHETYQLDPIPLFSNYSTSGDEEEDLAYVQDIEQLQIEEAEIDVNEVRFCPYDPKTGTLTLMLDKFSPVVYQIILRDLQSTAEVARLELERADTVNGEQRQRSDREIRSLFEAISEMKILESLRFSNFEAEELDQMHDIITDEDTYVLSLKITVESLHV